MLDSFIGTFDQHGLRTLRSETNLTPAFAERRRQGRFWAVLDRSLVPSTNRAMRSLNFERLKGKRNHQCSFRINDQWRLIVEIEKQDDGNVVVIINIEDYH